MKYIAYCRKSTDEKDKQVLSIDQQISVLKEYATREHLAVIDFVTEAKTAKIPGREKFGSLLKRIEKGEAQGIVSWHPDRLARNSVDGGKVIYLLDINKLLDLKFPQFWFESTPQGKFMLNIAFGQSKYYVDNLSENVKRGMKHKVKLGIWPMMAPLGYINDSRTKTIQIDSEKSKIVQKAFKLFAEDGRSFTEIARFLHKFGIPKSQRYKGHDFVFRGLARCGECGACITAEAHTKKYKNGNQQTFIHYRCTKKLSPCSQPYLNEEKFAEQVRGILEKCSIHESWQEPIEKLLEDDARDYELSAEDEIKKLKLQESLIDEKLNRLLDTYLDQVIDPETYKKKKNEIFEEKLKIEEEITKIKLSGSSWLEPMKNFIGSALSCAKIARTKNTCPDLAIGAKTVGSNFFLTDRQLSVNYNQGFAILCASPPAQRNFASAPSKSQSVIRLVS